MECVTAVHLNYANSINGRGYHSRLLSHDGEMFKGLVLSQNCKMTSYGELYLHTWFTAEEDVQPPPRISTSTYGSKLKLGPVTALDQRRRMFNLQTRNHFQTKSYDQVNNVTNQLNLSNSISSVSRNFIPWQEVEQ